MRSPTIQRATGTAHVLVALMGSGLVLPCSASGAETQTRPTPPSILFLICDQLTARVISAYGGPVATPHIDRLAREGVRFNQAICVTPFCSPSRASMITGMYPHAHGIVANCAPNPKAPSRGGIDANDVTIEGLLNKAGYVTHHYGKWHLFGDRLPYYPDMFNPDYELRVGEAPTADEGADADGRRNGLRKKGEGPHAGAAHDLCALSFAQDLRRDLDARVEVPHVEG
jgi:arylsulfatase A-like enzyme